jgi:hypothetical protein
MDQDPTEEELELYDIGEQAKTVGKLTPREYAKLHDKAPQLIYYHIRQGHIELEWCICGRRVVDVKTVDAFFQTLQASKKIQGFDVDTRSDADREGQGDLL